MWVSAGLVSLLVVAGCEDKAPTGELATIDQQPAVGQGAARELFITHCAACHGTAGHGDGPAAGQLFPRPRAFRDSPLRFASLGAGLRATRDGVVRTIRVGVPRSAMPGFAGVLEEAQIEGIAAYVMGMEQKLIPKAPIPPADMRKLVTTAPNINSPGIIERGRELFTSMKCISCHGLTGHGDGEEMNRLVDSLGLPIQPANLASGLFKSGGQPDEIFRVISNGVSGTPMTPYGGLLMRENADGSIYTQDVWALVAYVRSLAPRWRTGGTPSGLELRVQDIPDEAMFADLSHPGWMDVTWQQVTLRPTWERSAEPVWVQVAAVRAGERVGVMLSWPDKTMDLDKDFGIFPDAAAVMFAMDNHVPAIPMGVGIVSENPAGRVNIWHWKADRQYDATAGRRRMESGPRERGGGDRFEFPIVLGSKPAEVLAEDAAGFELLPSASAGNVHTDPNLVNHAALEANATGFGTLHYQIAGDQAVYGSAVWSNGEWTVAIHRDGLSGEDIWFTRGARIPVAFAVWDGSQGHRNGTKFVSGWHWLVIE